MQLASSHVEFKEFALHSIGSAYYHLAHFKAEINTREKLTKFKDVRPPSTRAVDSKRKLVEGNKETLAATAAFTGGINGLKPTALGSISGTGAKESSSTKEVQAFDSAIIWKPYKGAISWNFTVDDPNQQQHGVVLHELGTLPSMSCMFMGNSDDAPPPPAPDLFGVEVMSFWSLFASKSISVKLPTPYSNLCQIMKLDLPSQLSKSSYYNAVAKTTPGGSFRKAFDVKRPSSHKFAPSLEFPDPEEGAM